ncbi:MAG: hypothetical protein NZ898_09820 [Myxococcota bacterium]|nr:hypothetical protein [Myxococcota bacterium]
MSLRRVLVLGIGWVPLVHAIACGNGDGGNGTSTDAGPRDTGTGDGSSPVRCPTGERIPDPGGLMGACCYRASNATRLDAPELRLSGIDIQAPSSLGTAVVDALLAMTLDEERFNWLIDLTIEGTTATIRTGYGRRMPGPTYAFAMGDAPAPGDPNRWNPVTVTGTLGAEDTVSAPPLSGAFTVPIFDEMDRLTLELPLRNLELQRMKLSEGRSCVGRRRTTSYDTNDGNLVAFMTVEEADAGRVMVGTTLNTTLCMLAAGLSTRMGTCADTPRAEWMVRPDSLCNDSGCRRNAMGMTDVCDPMTTCNAWQIVSEFAAHGVEIAD